MEDEKKANVEAEKVVQWVKQESARINVEDKSSSPPSISLLCFNNFQRGTQRRTIKYHQNQNASSQASINYIDCSQPLQIPIASSPAPSFDSISTTFVSTSNRSFLSLSYNRCLKPLRNKQPLSSFISSRRIWTVKMESASTSLDGQDAEENQVAVRKALEMLQMDDPDLKVQAAMEIRRLTKTSHRCRRQLRQAVAPLVSMLRVDSPESHETVLLALLNLAVQDEKNKIKIVEVGALEAIINFLKSKNPNLQEYATASLLTLSASPTNKPIITSHNTIPLLVNILRDGNLQAKSDAVMALSNLSTYLNNLNTIMETNPIPYIINLLKTCKKSSKTAEKCCGLIESLMDYEEGRVSLTCEEGGVLAIVEVIENGNSQSKEYAVGALLKMCQSDRFKYREPILREGVIPGLLELTVQGTKKSQQKTHTLLKLLRESDNSRCEIEPDTLENIVCDIILNIDGDDDDDQCGKAKKMLSEMVQVSMEQSLRHLQKRALVSTTTSDLSIASEVSLK